MSLMSHMVLVKRKASNVGKILVSEFKAMKQQFLADIHVAAKVIRNEIPHGLVINWDQTRVKIIPTGDWTMHFSFEKIVPIAADDHKREITAVMAVTVTGKYLKPQLLNKGTTTICHLTVEFPSGWDIWHSANHWSNEETMKRSVEKF